MISKYLRLIRFSILLTCLLPLLVVLHGRVSMQMTFNYRFWLNVGGITAVVMASVVVLNLVLTRLYTVLEQMAAEQVRFVDEMPKHLIAPAIVFSAAASLFLELAVIRWHGCVWELFAFYKNFTLLSCFAGLGLGYALARQDRMPVVLTIPLLAFQMVALIALRHGLPSWAISSLRIMPFKEQLNMGLQVAATPGALAVVYFFLAVVMLTTALAFIPVGQLCGRLLNRTKQLRAYGLNLVGSIVGVGLMLGVSFLWTPPIVWFALNFAILLCFQTYGRKAVLIGGLSALAALIALAWPVSFLWEQVYSPYQLLERGRNPYGEAIIRAAGHYYQRLTDLSTNAVASSTRRQWMAKYYELPYRLHDKLENVAILGAGAGNDIAAALRCGVRHVDAVEIDPAIQKLGEAYHPERPYSDPRVNHVINDARVFLRSVPKQYDLIVYGLLDSHTLLSHNSNVRLDSFVYTVEGIRNAHERLKNDGIISLSFGVLSDEIGRKIYLMMTDAFGGKPPLCVRTPYDGSAVIFAQSKNGDLKLKPELLSSTPFEDRSAYYANPKIRADISTDDWPFFYMPQRVFPVSYVWMVLVVLIISVFLFSYFLDTKPQFSQGGFFFLGAGFMLVETKAITELGLTFGNTWQVIGIVIAAILIMAFLANLAVATFGLSRPLLSYLLLLGSIGFGLYMARHGGATQTGPLTAVIVLTMPMLFSGIVFSTLLAGTPDVSGALSMNLLGAMVGGLVEFSSMYFGFQFLYLIALVFYGAALISSLLSRGSTTTT